MALGTASALLLAGGVFSATTQLAGAGQQAKAIQKQAEYNAEVYGQQAEMIKEQKKIREAQFNRDAGRLRGSIIARTAGKGLGLGGSPLAILADNETQLQFDKAIEDYNFEIEANHARSGAAYYRESGALQARNARYAGYSNAFSTLLNTGTNYAALNYRPRLGKP